MACRGLYGVCLRNTVFQGCFRYQVDGFVQLGYIQTEDGKDMKILPLFAVSATLLMCGCSTMKTEHICLGCDRSKALADNSKPDQVSYSHACWYGKYDFSHDNEGKYCIYWDQYNRITQYGFESFEQESTVIVRQYQSFNPR